MSPTTDSDRGSNVSPPRELPTRWSEQFDHSLLSMSDDGRDLMYYGIDTGDYRHAATARTTHSIPAACGIYYYEVTILDKGQKGDISIGFAGHDVKLSRLPGWEADSWGYQYYHGDDGYSFSEDTAGTPYGPAFGTGDVIGCGIDFATRRVFFTKNGSFGHVFDNIGRDIDIYPSVGLRHTDQAIHANFGQDTFKYNLAFHVQQQTNHSFVLN